MFNFPHKPLKNKKLAIYTLAFFLIVNTAYFWRAPIGGFFFLLAAFILFLAFFVLLGFLLNQVFLSVGERFADFNRLLLIAFLSAVLGSVFYRPGGIIDFEGLKGAPLLTAYTKGSIYHIVFNLYKDSQFSEEYISISSGQRNNGKYYISGDTIKFEAKDYLFQYAIFKDVKKGAARYRGMLYFYSNKTVNDTVPRRLTITKNELL